MRNLEIIRRQKAPHFPDLSDSAVCLWEDSHLLICDKKSGILSNVTTDLKEDHAQVLCNDKEGLKDVVQMQYVPTTGFLYLAKGDGCLMKLRPDKGKQAELVEVCKWDDGINKFSVSPDSKLLAIITRQKRRMVLLSLTDLKCIAHDDFGENSSNAVRILWRKDGGYFAVNVSINSDDGEQRVIKIYDKNGSHHASTSLNTKEFAIMDESLAWKPSGRLLASYAKLGGAEAVIFFELNGEKHSHFLVDHVNEDILDICWNSTSDIVAARYQTCVELWTRSKNVWELKKILNNVENDHENVIFSSWDLNLPYKIHVLFDNGVYISDDVIHSYNSGLSAGSAITVSWNGNRIYCTPFRDNEAQPPYGFLQTTVPGTEHIAHVEVSSFWDGFLCITYTGHLIFYRRRDTGLSPAKRFVLPRDVFIHLIDGWAWPNLSTICCTHSGSILAFDLGNMEDEDESVVMKKEVELELKDCIRMDGENLLRIQTVQNANSGNNKASCDSSMESNEILAEADDNVIILVNLKTHQNEKLIKFSRVFAHYGHLKMKDNQGIIIFAHCPLSGELSFGLSNKDKVLQLYNDCTSVQVFNGNLLVTRREGILDVWNEKGLVEILLEQSNTKDNNASGDSINNNKYLTSRQIKKGSEIVSCCVNNTSQVSLVLEVISGGIFGIFDTICPLELPTRG